MAKRHGRSKLRYLLDRRQELRQTKATIQAERSASTWSINIALGHNDKAIKAERKRLREIKKANEL